MRRPPLRAITLIGEQRDELLGDRRLVLGRVARHASERLHDDGVGLRRGVVKQLHHP